MKKRVYAVCSFEGDFIELAILEEDEIINEDHSAGEKWGGYPTVTYRDLDGNEDTFYFIEVVEVN
jgi:hypothetical protein